MGRVFKDEEIIQLASFCEKHDLILAIRRNSLRPHS
jgi:bifunctional pyridoxal-dependent enzyme with beta-cystathionase and maltose regulon repressor activities